MFKFFIISLLFLTSITQASNKIQHYKEKPTFIRFDLIPKSSPHEIVATVLLKLEPTDPEIYTDMRTQTINQHIARINPEFPRLTDAEVTRICKEKDSKKLIYSRYTYDKNELYYLNTFIATSNYALTHYGSSTKTDAERAHWY